MKKILLHICCGPCAITCVERLRDQGLEVTGFFYNPNIHPGQEYLRRREGAQEIAARMGFPLLYPDAHDLAGEYDMQKYFTGISGRENERCLPCYEIRLQKLLEKAVACGFDLVSTSLLYSRYQKHDVVRAIGESLCSNSVEAGSPGVDFYYQDFRSGWSRGITLSKKWGIYRQQYCGCIFSETERYLKPIARSIAGSVPEGAEC